MMTGLAVAVLYLSAIFPTMRLALIVIAGLFTSVAIIECSISAGIMVFAATSILGLIISPLRGNVLIYFLFFGHYPILKGLLEKLRPIYLEWALKIILFNICFAVAFLLYKAGFLSQVLLPDIAVLLLFVVANIVFVVYDLGFSRLISLYYNRFRKK